MVSTNASVPSCRSSHMPRARWSCPRSHVVTRCRRMPEASAMVRASSPCALGEGGVNRRSRRDRSGTTRRRCHEHMDMVDAGCLDRHGSPQTLFDTTVGELSASSSRISRNRPESIVSSTTSRCRRHGTTHQITVLCNIGWWPSGPSRNRGSARFAPELVGRRGRPRGGGVLFLSRAPGETGENHAGSVERNDAGEGRCTRTGPPA